MSELIQMADFVLKNNYFEFKGQIKKQISGTAIGTKFALLTRIRLEIKLKLLFLRPKNYTLWCGLDILTIIFFIWTNGEQELETFLRSLNEFHTSIKFKYELSKESTVFLDLKVSVKNSNIITDLYVKSADRH